MKNLKKSFFRLRRRLPARVADTPSLPLTNAPASRASSVYGSSFMRSSFETGIGDGSLDMTPRDAITGTDDRGASVPGSIQQRFNVYDGILDVVWKFTKIVTALVGLVVLARSLKFISTCQSSTLDANASFIPSATPQTSTIV